MFCSVVPNPQAEDQYRSVGQLLPGHIKIEKHNLLFLCFIYNLILEEVWFRKTNRFSISSNSFLTSVKSLSQQLAVCYEDAANKDF